MHRSWKNQHADQRQPGRGFARRGWSRTLNSIGAAIVMLVGSATYAVPQGSSESQIIAPTLLTIKSATETGLPIRVITSHEDAFILIKGLPKAVALSTGRLFDSGVWAVKVSELGELKIVAMVTATEEHPLTLSLKTLEGNVLAEFDTALRISPVAGDDNAGSAANEDVQTAAVAAPVQPEEIAPPPPSGDQVQPELAKTDPIPAVAEPPVISEADMESILLLMRKGSENIQQGNINVARLFYARAADKGWADAAFALARTYDAVELQKIGAIGVDPEPEEAAKWYRRAVELGSATAVAYLQRLQ